MRIAATDYDGTLCIKGNIAEKTLEAIRKWRSAGNIFGIVTGRDRGMILYEINRWEIPFDFILCCNGAVLYDKDLTQVYALNLEDSAVPLILNHPSAKAGLHYEICCSGDTLLHVLHADSWFPSLGPPYTEISRERALACTHVQQIGLAYKTIAETGEHASALNAALGKKAYAHHNNTCIDVTPPNVSKANGLHRMLEHGGLSGDALLVIGDGGNDLPMIREYKGFTVPHGTEELHSEASAVYDDVGAMLAAHMP